MRQRLSFLLALLPFLLEAAVPEVRLTYGDTTVLENNKSYYVTTPGTYTVTTHGAVVQTYIDIGTNSGDVILCLKDCHIEALAETKNNTIYGSPLLLTSQNTQLHLQFEGDNSLCCAKTLINNQNGAAITYLPKTFNTLTRAFSLTLEGRDEQATLTLEGRTSPQQVAYAPIAFPSTYTLNGKTTTVTSSVRLKRGNIHLLATDTTTSPYLSPAILASEIILAGAHINLALAPYNTTHNKLWVAVARDFQNAQLNPLFQATTVTFRDGTLSTRGQTPESTISKNLSAPYATRYAYPATLFYLPAQTTTLRGSLYGPSTTTHYGLKLVAQTPDSPLTTEDLKPCFNATAEMHLDANTITIDAPDATLRFSTPDINETKVLGASALFDLPLIVTDQGLLHQPHALGIAGLSISANKTLCLHLALDCPTIDNVTQEKTLTIEIICNDTVIKKVSSTLRRQEGTTTFHATLDTEAPITTETHESRFFTFRMTDE